MRLTTGAQWLACLLGLSAAALLLSGHIMLGAWIGFAASGLEVACFGAANRERLRQPVSVRMLLRRREDEGADGRTAIASRFMGNRKRAGASASSWAQHA
jgi:hypothetical protein